MKKFISRLKLDLFKRNNRRIQVLSMDEQIEMLKKLENLIAEKKNSELIQEFNNFKKRGLDINSEFTYQTMNGNVQGTLLTYACTLANKECIDFLIDSGSSIEKGTDKGLTPLMVALAFNNFDAAEALLERGPDIEKSDLNGYTALMHAVNTSANTYSFNSMRRKIILEKLLVNASKDFIDKKSNDGNSALRLLFRNTAIKKDLTDYTILGNVDLFNVLKDKNASIDDDLRIIISPDSKNKLITLDNRELPIKGWSTSDIVKNSVFVQNITDKYKANAIIDNWNIDNDHYNLSVLKALIAFYMVNPEEYKTATIETIMSKPAKGLKIRMARDGNIENLVNYDTPERFSRLGETQTYHQIIDFSFASMARNTDYESIVNDSYGILVHECMHLIDKNVGLGISPSSNMSKAINQTLQKYEEYKKTENCDKKIIATLDTVFIRIKSYIGEKAKAQEYMSDLMRIYAYAETNPECGKAVLNIVSPLGEHFEKRYLPKMERQLAKFLDNNKHINIPENFKSEVCQKLLERRENRKKNLAIPLNKTPDKTNITMS